VKINKKIETLISQILTDYEKLKKLKKMIFFLFSKLFIFVEANAEIQGDTVGVSNPKIKKPVAVRYGWNDTAEPNL